MFGGKKVKEVCDTACRAQRLREAAAFKAAQQGPRI
jgi:hypothetical protein